MTLSLLINSRRGVSVLHRAARSLSRTVQRNQPDRDPTGNGGIRGNGANEAEHSQMNGTGHEHVETTHFGFQDIPVNEKVATKGILFRLTRKNSDSFSRF